MKTNLTAGHKLHHDVSVGGLALDEAEATSSGPNTERWLNQWVHGAAGQIPGVPADPAGRFWSS